MLCLKRDGLYLAIPGSGPILEGQFLTVVRPAAADREDRRMLEENERAGVFETLRVLGHHALLERERFLVSDRVELVNRQRARHVEALSRS